jgi:hypothetical protein
METPQINLVAAWIGILLGFLSGMLMGLFFHREQWLGGYSSFKRRLYRLAHISLFGLGVVNLCFFFTVRMLSLSGAMVTIASCCLLAGAVSMPMCCVAMAHFPRTLPLFSVPVLGLLAGGMLTLIALLQTDTSPNVLATTRARSGGQHPGSEQHLTVGEQKKQPQP